MNNPIVIVGRGPTGMTTALTLSRWNIPSIIIDPLPSDEARPGSKAVLISGHVIAMTEPLGVGSQIEAEGLAWTTSRTFVRGKQVLLQDVSNSADLIPRVTNLTQQRVEELLLAKVHADPLITLMSESRIIDFTEEDDSVRVRVETQGGLTELFTEWLVGCDGARSTVRKQLDIQFEGYGHEENFLIVDISADLPFPDERHFHFDAPFNPGRTTLIHPQPDSTWHIDFQVGADIDAEEERSSGRLDKRIRAVIGDIPYELHWLTTYRFKQLRARQFQKGRCFLVGDAAHLTSPYGARGMNSGISDAENLAWRLAMVRNHGAKDTLLDGYAVEREYASSENLRITGQTARFMCPDTQFQQLRRRVVLEASRLFPAARRLINSGKFYEPATYPPALLGADSSLGAGLSVGEYAPDGLVSTNQSDVSRLSQFLRRGIALIIFPNKEPVATENVVTKVLENLPPDFPLTVIEVVRGMPAPTNDGRHIRVHDVDGSLTASWEPDAGNREAQAYLVRPDAYITSRPALNPTSILRALTNSFGLKELQKGIV